jgi:hypothetical protein
VVFVLRIGVGFPEVLGIRRIVPKHFHGEFGVFWGFEKSEGLFSRGKRGFWRRVVPARAASCSRTGGELFPTPEH